MKISIHNAALRAALQSIVETAKDKIVGDPAFQAANAVLGEAIIQGEADRLAQCINRQIDAYYASYAPSMYNRSGDLKEAAEARPGVTVIANGRELQAIVTIKDVPGQSLFGGAGYDQVRLIDEGWQVRSDARHADVPHFGYQAGFGFVQKGVADFLSTNPYNSLGAQ